MRTKAEEQEDRIAEEYLRGDKMTRQVIKDTLTAFPLPRWKLAVALIYPTLMIGLWGGLQFTGYQLVKVGFIQMSPFLWFLDAFTAFVVAFGSWALWKAYRSNKPDIERMIGIYSVRHPNSELAKEYFKSRS